MTNFEDFINAGGEDLSKVATAKTNPKYARERFTCESCSGTGFWRHGVNHRGNGKCNTCHGKGYLVTSPDARRKARRADADRKIKRGEKAKDANAKYVTLFKWIEDNRNWNDFAESMHAQHHNGRAWSEKQIDACARVMEKAAAAKVRKQREAAEREAAAPSVDLTAIRAMFDAAFASGYKRPSYRAEGIIIKPAPATGANAGALYVMDSNRTQWGAYGETPAYAGKLLGGKYLEARGSDPAVAESLLAVAKDPLAAALAYGRRTGRCACCGRELTKHASIEDGIGPVCKGKWGF